MYKKRSSNSQLYCFVKLISVQPKFRMSNIPTGLCHVRPHTQRYRVEFTSAVAELKRDRRTNGQLGNIFTTTPSHRAGA